MNDSDKPLPPPFFSIVIPCYNYADYLPRAVNSVTEQAFDGVEILIVDDGSTDETESVAQSLGEACEDNVLHYLWQENKGAAAARNKGVSASSGEFILFLDADDALMLGSLEKIQQFLLQHVETDVLFGGHISVFQDGREKASKLKEFSRDNQENFADYIFKNISVVNGAMVVRREILETIRYNEALRVAEDIPVFALLIARYSCSSIGDPLVRVFKHDDSLRHNSRYSAEANTGVVDEIFGSPLLPEVMQKHRQKYRSLRWLSAFRTLYKAGKWEEARRAYLCALSADPRALLKLRALGRFLHACFK